MIRTLATFLITSAMAAAHAVTVGQAAPDFSLTDVNGKTVKLSDFKGKNVVLEWTNPGCPFVVKHYGSNNMQTLQADAKAKGVVWLSAKPAFLSKPAASPTGLGKSIPKTLLRRRLSETT